MSVITSSIDRALKHYQRLSRVTESGYLKVKGTIPISHPKKGEIDRYTVLISFPEAFPKCFPKVVETSKKIPREADRHVNPDHTLCLAVEPEERLLTRNGVSFKYFLDKVLVPHLARETYRERTGAYPDGEYSHGDAGIWEYYEALFGLNNKQQILRELEMIAFSTRPGRNDKCFCGGEVKFKNCHLRIYDQVLKSGVDYLLEQVSNLKKSFKNE